MDNGIGFENAGPYWRFFKTDDKTQYTDIAFPQSPSLQLSRIEFRKRATYWDKKMIAVESHSKGSFELGPFLFDLYHRGGKEMVCTTTSGETILLVGVLLVWAFRLPQLKT